MTTNARKPSYWINSAISLLIMFTFGFIPPVFGLTEIGMALIGTLLGTVYGWMTIEIAWPTMAGFIALAVWGYDSMNNILQSAFGNSTVVMMIFILTFTMYMNRCGCMDSISKWFISRKFIVGRPYVVILIFFALSAVLSFATSNIAAMLFVFSVAISFCERLGYTKGSKYPIVLLFVIYLGTQFGMAVIPIKPVMLMTISLMEAAANITVNRGLYILISIAVYAVATATWLLAVRFIIRPEVEPFKNMTEDSFAEYRNLPFPKEVKIGFAALILMVILMLGPTFLPSTWAITAFCNKIGVTGAVLLVCVLLSIMPKEEISRFNFNTVANSGNMNWNLILMTGFALTIASALSSDASGFTNAINTNLIPIMGNFSPILLIIVFGTILHLLTNVLNNGGMMAIFVNPIATIAAAMGMNPYFSMQVLNYAMGDGLLTPAGTASSPLLMGHDWMDMKEYYKHAIAIFVGFEIFIVLAAFLLF